MGLSSEQFRNGMNRESWKWTSGEGAAGRQIWTRLGTLISEKKWV